MYFLPSGVVATACPGTKLSDHPVKHWSARLLHTETLDLAEDVACVLQARLAAPQDLHAQPHHELCANNQALCLHIFDSSRGWQCFIFANAPELLARL